MYSFIREILFAFQPETSHTIALKSLRLLHDVGITSLLYRKKNPEASKQVMDLYFPNPVGLAAGLDKNGDYIDALASLGFGFIEVGTVTLRPQAGNPKPRLFRIPEKKALINRMGFNNEGVDYLVERLKKRKYKVILGINIGKNKDTPLENAAHDYVICMRKVYEHASYITINISSPNTEGLRNLQHSDFLDHLLSALRKEQQALFNEYRKYVPLVVKIAPDLSDDEIKMMSQVFLQHEIKAVIATNTTISREGIENLEYAKEKGGLSGAPLFQKSHHVVQQLQQYLGDQIPIIACGGITSANDAKNMFDAGASLLQIYTGFIYQGPGLIEELIC